MQKHTLIIVTAAIAVQHSLAARTQAGPIQKVIQLLGDIQMKRIKEVQNEQENYRKFSHFCEKTATEKQKVIADFKEQLITLKATSDTAISNIEQLDATVEELSEQISSGEEQMKESSQLRAKEHKDFLVRDADLGGTVDMLSRAHMVLKKNLNSANSAFIETSMQKAIPTLKSIVDASFVSLEDRSVIEALIQESSNDYDSSSLDFSVSLSKPYEEKSNSILDTIAGMKEKAQVTRNEGQKQETKAQHTFEMFSASVQSELDALKKQLDDSKKRKNRNAEMKATSEGDTETVTKDLAADEKALADLQRECMEGADGFTQSQAEAALEINVLAKAKKILAAAAKGAALVQDQQEPDDKVLSFLQTRMATRTRTASQMQRDYQLQAADYLTKEGDRIGSWVLAQVGSHVQADPFGKVKGMIEEMVEKLLQEQAEEAEHKVWCDAELTKSKKSLTRKQSKLDDIANKIKKAQATSAKLDEQAKTLVQELAELDAQDQEATQLRQQEHEEFEQVKAEIQGALDATSTAVKVLKNYYSGKSFMQTETEDTSPMTSMRSLIQEHLDQPKGGAAASVIGLLEVGEADFGKALAQKQSAEDAAQQEYEEMIQDNRVSRAEKIADQKNKLAEKGRLDNLVSETKLDSKDASDELSAVMEYLDKLKGSCETKAPSFEERQARRKQEMEGLQNALAILDGKAIAFLETGGVGGFPSALSMLRR
jgi:hypothetical protein